MISDQRSAIPKVSGDVQPDLYTEDCAYIRFDSGTRQSVIVKAISCQQRLSAPYTICLRGIVY